MVWPPHINHGMSSRLIAVAIDRDKGSQISLKWTVENLVAKGPNQISDMDDNGSTNGESAAQTKALFLPFHVYCARKDISCYDVLLEDTDVTKAITEFVKQSGIDVLVLGATAKGNIFRYMSYFKFLCLQ
ncbi:uncharacterized protein LOC111376353 isoform X2 [Olea europaea var. sylvestris]|uniref:uncharacterized protein LOC111376353 isoform X2 n=1 Tax=Olea europaea var. sylvestris TaxID=158386 RepID=UPI000C1D10CC|nr:uncharacterized protein LOC111376353 isoform X2 [Olea europaea var. sylvestris]